MSRFEEKQRPTISAVHLAMPHNGHAAMSDTDAAPGRWAKQAGQRKKGGTTKHGYSADDNFVCDDSEDEVESSSDSSDGGSSGEDSDGGGSSRQGQAQRRHGCNGKGAKGVAEAGRGGVGGGQQQQQQPGEEEETKWLEQAKASLFEQNLLQVRPRACGGVLFRGLAVSYFPLPCQQ